MKKKNRSNLPQVNDHERFEPSDLFEGIESQMKSPSQFIAYKTQSLKSIQSATSIRVPVSDYISENLSSFPPHKKTSENQVSSIQESSLRSLSPSISQNTQGYLTKITTKTQQRESRKKKYKKGLKDLIHTNKVKKLAALFIQKLNRNNQYSSPVQCQIFQNKKSDSWFDLQGYQVSTVFQNVIAFLSILLIIFLCLIYTLEIIFVEIRQNSFIQQIQLASFLFYLFQIVFNMLTVKNASGVKLKTFRKIWKHYFDNNLLTDIISIIILLIDISSDNEAIYFIRLFIITKLPSSLDKIAKLEIAFIKNYYHQQYWSLVKVFLFNFCFAHILAVFLLLMAKIDTQNNWMIKKGINSALWYEKYCWAYYWGTNIMLTVGFGDINASTYKQALILTFIQMVSCICLAYNISCIGTLISNIIKQSVDKGKDLKVFQQLAEKNKLSVDLSSKISNYIQQSANIKKVFNIQCEEKFINNLPLTYKTEILKQSNKKIFSNILFFKNLMDKTQQKLAENIQVLFCHPEETIRHFNSEFDLYVLKQGKVGLTCKKTNCDFNEMVIDTVNVNAGENPFLCGLEFLTLTRPKYEIKSLVYSIIYFLKLEKLLSIIKDCSIDFEHFFNERDMHKNYSQNFQDTKCKQCQNQHSSFNCPKLHFMPIKQKVIFKQLFGEKKATNRRHKNKNQRIQLEKTSSLTNQKQIDSLKDCFKHLFPQSKNQKSTKKNKSKFNPFRIDELNLIKMSQIEQCQGKSNQNSEENLLEVIKTQLSRHLKSDNFEDEVWTINCDKMKNYKNYFPLDNSCNLPSKFNFDKRICEMVLSNKEINSESINGQQQHMKILYKQYLSKKMQTIAQCEMQTENNER